MSKPGGTDYGQNQFTVTNSAKTLFAAQQFGREVTIQNNHASAIVYVKLGGDAVVTTDGMLVVKAGKLLSIPDVVNSVSVIGSIASNTAVTALDGNWRD